MAYDRLYPFGYERHDQHTANIVRQIAFGPLTAPSAKLSDYLTYTDYEQPAPQVIDIKTEQDHVVSNLDMIFG